MAWRLDWTNGLSNCSKEFELPPTKSYCVLLTPDLIIWLSHNSYKFFWLLSFLNGKVHLTWTRSSEGCGFTLHDQRSFCDFAIKHRNDIILFKKILFQGYSNGYGKMWREGGNFIWHRRLFVAKQNEQISSSALCRAQLSSSSQHWKRCL